MSPTEKSGGRPDWAPVWWTCTDLHHTLGGVLERIGRAERRAPGLLATALEREAAYLHASVSRCACAAPNDATEEEGGPLDAELEDRHHDWVAGGGPGRKAAHLAATRLSNYLQARHARRHAHGRPFSSAA